MIKKVFALAMVALFGANVMAQGVQEATVNVGALTVPAYTLSVNKDVKMVQEAMKQRLKDAKLKTKSVEGYVACQDVIIPEISTGTITLYTKVEEQGKKKNKTTVVTVCAVSNDLTIDQMNMRNNVRNWLNDFVPYISKFEAGQNMEAEQANLKKAEKQADKAAAEVTGLEKDIASAEKKIADKREEIKKYEQKIKDCQKEIADLEKSIGKYNDKKATAEKKVDEAQQNVKAVEGEVEKYRQMSE